VCTDAAVAAAAAAVVDDAGLLKQLGQAGEEKCKTLRSAVIQPLADCLQEQHLKLVIMAALLLRLLLGPSWLC